ncbi:MAG TPA: hypothetical protein VI685_20655 [Candidatus Angelobacter sp.]
MEKLPINSVGETIIAAINSDPRAQALQQFFQDGARIYVLAGALRDAIAQDLGQQQSTPRDFDIAVGNVKREAFDEVLQSFGMLNRHGGYMLSAPGAPNWDVWRLEESIGLRKTGARCSLETVLRTFNLDCNAIAMDLSTGLFLDAGAIEAIRRRRVNFAESALHHSHGTFAAKALLLDLRLGYRLSPEMRSFVRRWLESDSLLHEARKVFPHLHILPSPEEH